MNAKRTGRISIKPATDWKRIRSLKDSQVRKAVEEDPDVHGTTPEFWANARIVLPQPKQPITIRLDADLLAWLRSQKGYQTRINAVLRTFMQASRRRVTKMPSDEHPSRRGRSDDVAL
jgi:uncharacterized protein (DUF4415 family)